MNSDTRRLTLWAVVAALVLTTGCASSSRSETPDGQLGFGIQMARRGLWNEALFRFEQADQLRPGNPQTLNNLAVAYEATGRYDEALEVYRRALTIDAGNRELRRNYSRFVEFYQAFQPEQPALVPETPVTDGGTP